MPIRSAPATPDRLPETSTQLSTGTLAYSAPALSAATTFCNLYQKKIKYQIWPCLDSWPADLLHAKLHYVLDTNMHEFQIVPKSKLQRWAIWSSMSHGFLLLLWHTAVQHARYGYMAISQHILQDTLNIQGHCMNSL